MSGAQTSARANADAYVFESTRIRALENGLIGTDRLERLLNAEGLTRCEELLEEFGVELVRDPETEAFDRERTLELRLKRAYREALSVAEGDECFRLWLFPYDCNNIKVMIKCRYRGVRADEMLFDYGTVGLDKLKEIFSDGSYEKLPVPFGEATAEAVRALSATANPQTVDLILDAACYRAMLDLAKQSGVKFAETLVMQKIDLTNLVTCLRRMRSSDRYVGEILPREFFLEGGSFSYEFLRGLCQAGEEEFWTRMGYSAYESVVLRDARHASLGAVERACDNFFMSTVRSARMIPYGAEPIIAYLLATEFEVKNLRILLSGQEISLSQKEIRKRMRLSYV